MAVPAHQASTGVLTSATAQGTTSMTVAYPAGVSAGRKALLFASVKLSSATFSDPAGWTLVGTSTGGTGASANDAGTTRLSVWEKDLDGSESGSVTVTNSGGVSCAGAMSIYTSSLGGWAATAFVTASDTTHGTNPTGTTGTWASALAVDDRVVVGFSNDTDTAAATPSFSMTQTGTTYGTVTHRNQTLSTSGTDSGVDSWDAAVTSGGSTNALTTTMTTATTMCGAFVAVRLREATPPANPVHAAHGFLAYGGAGATSAAIPIPAGVVSGSTCVVRLMFETTTTTLPGSLTPPASGGTWAHVNTKDLNHDGTNITRQVVYEYRAAGSESGTWTFTWTNSLFNTCTSHRITGAATTGSIFDSPVDHEAAGTAATAAPATQLTTPGADRLLLWLAVGIVGGAVWTPPSGFTEVQDDPNISSAWKVQAAAGDTGALTGSNDSTDKKVAFLGGIGPPAGGADATATPAVVAATATVPNGARNVAAGPTVAAATTTVPASQRNIRAGPAAVAATTTLPSGARNITAGPSATATATALPAATAQVGTNATATPAATAATTTVPASTRNIAAAPASVPATVTIPTATAGMGAGPTRQLDSADDHVICAVGSGGMATLTTGAWTVATLARRSTDGTWDTIASFETSGNSAQAGLQIRDTNLLCGLFASDNNSTGGVAAPASDGWCVYAVTKAAGTATPRTHKVVVSTGTPTHTNATSSHGNGASVSGGRLQFGRWQSSDLLGGWLAMVAAWDQVLSDGEVEQLAVGLQEWLDLAPTGLWQFRQASTGTAVTDDIGDADQTSLTGTTVDAVEGPAPFDWEVSGDATATPAAVAATATLPTAARNVGAGPAAVAALVAMPQATPQVGTGATAAPATITATTTVPTSNRNISASSATVAATVAAPQTTAVGGGAAAFLYGTQLGVPTAQLGDFQLGTTPAVSGNVTVTPATVTAAAAFGQATPSASTTLTPATVAATTTHPASFRNVGAGPAVLTSAASLVRPGVNVAAGPTVLVGSVAVPQATAVAATNATATPAVVAAATALTRPAGTVAAGPTVLLSVAALGQATAQASATRVPAVIAALAGIPQAAAVAGGGATVTPSVIAAVAALARPAANVAAGPALATLPVAVPQATPTAAGNATPTPAVLAAIAALGQAAPSASSTRTPAVLAAAVTIGGVGASIGAAPAVLAALTGLSRPSVYVAAGPAVLPLVVGLPAPTILAGGNVTMTPATVAAVTTLVRASVNVVAGPAGLATSIALSRPLIDVAAGPATILSVVAVGLAVPQVGAGGTPTPATIATTAALARPNVTVRAGPLAIPLLVALPVALAGQSISRTPATVASVAGMAAVAVSTSAGPPAIAVLITLPAVADAGGEPNPGGGQVVVGVPGGGIAVAVGHGHGLVVMPTRGTVSAGRTGSEVTVG